MKSDLPKEMRLVATFLCVFCETFSTRELTSVKSLFFFFLTLGSQTYYGGQWLRTACEMWMRLLVTFLCIFCETFSTWELTSVGQMLSLFFLFLFDTWKPKRRAGSC